tara:strand:- start:1 stop:483 length:483 start_codon:yes stop_codon:yes gene_type:complete
MGGWIQYAPDAWQWSPDHDFGEQKEWPRHRYKSQFHKGKCIMHPDQFNNKSQKHVATLNREAAMSNAESRRTEKLKSYGRSNTGRLKVGTTIAFVEYPQKGPRQMMVILEKLQEFGEGGITIGMFWQKLEGQLNTKQDVDRVYKHYHREMVDKGYIRILS